MTTDILRDWPVNASTAVVKTSGRPIERVRVFRVSSRNTHLLIQNLVAGLGQAEHGDPDVKLAKEICPLVAEATIEGAAARHLDRGMIEAWRTGRLRWETWTDTRVLGLTECQWPQDLPMASHTGHSHSNRRGQTRKECRLRPT